jgi:hypothetical protein
VVGQEATVVVHHVRLVGRRSGMVALAIVAHEVLATPGPIASSLNLVSHLNEVIAPEASSGMAHIASTHGIW